MSDNMRFSVVISEGVHDVMAIRKIMKIKGFDESSSLNTIPAPLQNTIPRKYPFGDSAELTWLVAHPTFLYKGDYWVLVSNAGGDSKLSSNLKGLLDAFHKQQLETAMRGIAILGDADTADAAKRKDVLYRQLRNTFRDCQKYMFDTGTPEEIRIHESTKPLAVYIFPDDRGSGTLEHILLEGAEEEYPELSAEAEKYVTYAKTLYYAKNLENRFNAEKARVGVIANALRPGKANQVSIWEDDWFTSKSLADLPRHSSLAQFVDTIIGWG